jgi:hypothetical protein
MLPATPIPSSPNYQPFTRGVPLLVVLSTAARQDAFDLYQFSRLLIEIITLAAASYSDHVQSVVLGSLVGMLAPVCNRTRVDAHVWPVLLFLALQTVTALVPLLTSLVIVPAVYQALHLTGWYTAVSPPLIGLVMLYLLREGVITVLWRVLVYQLNADLTDLAPSPS